MLVPEKVRGGADRRQEGTPAGSAASKGRKREEATRFFSAGWYNTYEINANSPSLSPESTLHSSPQHLGLPRDQVTLGDLRVATIHTSSMDLTGLG